MRSVQMKNIEKNFRKKGIISTSEMIEKKIRSEEVKKALKSGRMIKIKRGLYRLTKSYEGIKSDFEDISRASLYAVIFLTSALSYYDFTTYVSEKITVMMPMNMTFLKIENPPVKIHYTSIKPYNFGVIEEKTKNGVIRITDRERTVCDIFRYRNKIGLDLAIEGLKEYLKTKDFNVNKLVEYAEKLRMKNVMMPYIMAILG